MPTPQFISYGHSRFRYYRYGSGKRLLCCLHGYGEDGSHFAFLEPILGNKYTLLALEMPFHGATEWNGPLLLEPAMLMEVIQQITPEGAPLDLLGYSMGGRIGLTLLQEYPHRFGQLVLLAPDGLHKNPWQKLATRPGIGNRLFAYTMKHPGWLFNLMQAAGKLGLFNKSLLRFVHHYLDHPKERQLLYKRWTTLRKFRPNLPILRERIKAHQVPVHMLFGRYDRIIVERYGYAFARNMAPLIQVHTVEGGHHLLKAKYAQEILTLFNTPAINEQPNR